MPRDSMAHTFKVATLLCLVCALLVSSAAVLLRDKQQLNRDQEKQRNILIVAGFEDELEAGTDIEELFRQIETKIVVLKYGTYNSDLDPKDFNQEEASKDPKQSDALTSEADIASIKREERHSLVYLVKKNGKLDQIVLPIRGYGLWSTLWGFLSLDAQSLKAGPENLKVRGITYYKQEETPGLGGEVENPRWKALWNGKRVYDKNWNVIIKVSKNATGETEVDALSGATLTSRGVQNMMKFWLGTQGFQPYLKRLRQELLSKE